MAAIVKLGIDGSLRDYVVKERGDGLMWDRNPANPFAARVNASSKFDEVDAWNEWALEDWQAGVGRVDTDQGGFLYGEVETRVPNQIILPHGTVIMSPFPGSLVGNYWETPSWSPGEAADFATLTLGNTYLACEFQAYLVYDGTFHTTAVYCYVEAAQGTVIRADVYSESGGSPNTSYGNASLTIPAPDFPGPHWYKINLSIANTGDVTAEHWVVFRVTTGTAKFYGSAVPTNRRVKTSTDGAAWSTGTFCPFFNLSGYNVASTAITKFASPKTFSDISYASFYGTEVYFVGTGEWVTPGNRCELYVPGQSGISPYQSYLAGCNGEAFEEPYTTRSAVFAGAGAFGRGTDYPMIKYTLGTAVLSEPDATVYADVLYAFGGYMYRSVGEDLYYTNSDTWTAANWEGPFPVCSAPDKIRSMAIMGEDLYLACDDGLYRLLPDSSAKGIVQWPRSSENGRRMVSVGGSLYIIVNGRVWRFTADGSVQDIWVNRDDDLPANRLGRVMALEGTDASGLIALVQGTTTASRSSVWTFNDEGWHHIATLPFTNASLMHFDRNNLRIYVATDTGEAAYIPISTYALNPFNDPNSKYMPAGWIQWDRYYGGQYLLDKSWESITVIGDNLSANVNVTLYWQDEGSTGWEELGTATADGTELRWSNFATRPKGRWVKIAMLMRTNDPDVTPRVRTLVVKFLPMVNDRLRDAMTLTLRDYIEHPDGTRDTYTRAQQWAHLFSVAVIKSVDPVIYEDIFGDQYEVHVIDWGANAAEFAHYGNSNVVTEMEVRLVLDQLPDEQYA